MKAARIVMLGRQVIFATHSVRAAVVSKAKVANIPIAIILRTAGWSSVAMFTRYYKKPIIGDIFANAILA